MATQRNSIEHRGDQPSHRSSLRGLFVWYCAGALITALVATGAIDGAGLLWIALRANGRSPLFGDLMSQSIGILLITVVPICALVASISLFAWLMGRRIIQPVTELMGAVEKIRQQDLDFSISYGANDELGDLCGAIGELRGELRASLEREWREQEEMRLQVATLAHDLRTPVTIIQGHIEGLARAPEGERRSQRLERYLPVLEANSKRMARLLNDILLTASLEQTSIAPELQTVWLEEEFARKARDYQLRAAAQSISFSFSGGAYMAEPFPVCLHVHYIERIVDNLFENALGHTPASGAIRLSYAYDREAFSFVVRDTGGGIATQDLPHVFEKFYRGQAMTAEQARKGAGLGLYICKLLAGRLGGTIEIQNISPHGCEVMVHLPLGETPAHRPVWDITRFGAHDILQNP